ncbi:hypothetical protein [Paenibacillus herberti]|uniref:YHS domain protein n=1 Tax=Paenibacillus herberti TaxID=1619309 RepID=A0A229P2U0_9BACL|nr:hypothetical protein [Paenibacillus herberti]OXM16573.1 hypothetical protein CGZ75_07890 [Paenibacillus herberti]
MPKRLNHAATFAAFSLVLTFVFADLPEVGAASPAAISSSSWSPAAGENIDLPPVFLPANMAEAFEASSAPQTAHRPVQIFDINAGKVVRTLDNSAEYQQMAKSWLDSAEGLSANLSPDEKCGYVFRIPLQEPYELRKGTLTFQVEDVFLFYCKEREPELLVFDKKKKPYLLTANPDLTPFFNKTGIQP